MNQSTTCSFYDIEVTTLRGQNITLAPYKGQVLLIVNVASRCGFTRQYAELETLYRELKDRKFNLLAFPCDQFLRQEPGTNEEIQVFAESCFQVSFPLFSKIEVKGKNQAPLYAYLAKNIEKKPWKLIPWNFTKILVDAQGNVLKRYWPTTSFKKIRQEIESLLP